MERQGPPDQADAQEHESRNGMTTHVPVTAQPLGLATSSSAGIGSALDRIAYVVLCAFVFDLPWGEYVPQVGGLVLGTWIGLLAVGVMALRTAVTWRRRILSPLHYWMLSLVAWSALSIFWTLDWDSTVTRVGTYLQVLTMVWLIWELAVTGGRIVGLLQAYVFGALVASIGTIYNFMAGHTAAQLASTIPGKVVWETYRYSFAYLNEDDLGLVLAINIPMVFYLLVSRKGSLVKLLCWLQLVAGVAAILLTGARGALVAAIASLAMLPLTVFRLPRLLIGLFSMPGTSILVGPHSPVCTGGIRRHADAPDDDLGSRLGSVSRPCIPGRRGGGLRAHHSEGSGRAVCRAQHLPFGIGRTGSYWRPASVCIAGKFLLLR
jgi:hypothetical protein